MGSETDFALDFLVLEHLRGYPDDLTRYANLMKQAHPRGRSAVDHLLRGPHAAGFVETVAALVRDGEDVVSAVEAAEMAGLAPRQFLDEIASRSDFPSPVFAEDHRRLWRRADVVRYLRQ